MSMREFLKVALVLFLCGGMVGQPPAARPEFEVATMKLNLSGDTAMGFDTGRSTLLAALLMFAAVEKLGLKLESKRLAVPVVVIDHVEKPALNRGAIHAAAGRARETSDNLQLRLRRLRQRVRKLEVRWAHSLARSFRRNARQQLRRSHEVLVDGEQRVRLQLAEHAAQPLLYPIDCMEEITALHVQLPRA